MAGIVLEDEELDDIDLLDNEDPDLFDFSDFFDNAEFVPQKTNNQGFIETTLPVMLVDMERGVQLHESDTAGRQICVYVDTLEGLLYVKETFKAWLKTLTWLSLDIETYQRNLAPFKKNQQPGWNSDLIGAISFSDGVQTYVFKIDGTENPQMCTSANIRELIVEAAKLPWVGHNLKFDLRFIKRDYGVTPPFCYDTFLAAKIISCKRKEFYNLGAVAFKYLEYKISKDLQTSNWGAMMFTMEQVGYSARDTWIVALLVPVMTDLMNNIPNSTSANKNSPFSKIWGLTNKIAHLEFSLLPRLMEMEYRGVYLDTPRVQQHFTSLVALETTLKQKFFDTLPPKQKRINPNSPKQLIQYLHKTIGDQGFTRPDGKFRALKHMTKWRKNPKTYEEELVYSTDQDELKEFVGKGIPEVDALYKYKSATANIKRIQEFFSLVQKDSRLYTSFKQWGAISGRLSCPKPNLQNIKNKEKEGINLRSLFCSPPGRKLVVVDYSQIQLVIIAEISQDPMMLAIINSPQKINNPKYPELDLHIATAATVNGIEYDEVTADQRKAAKAANFGLCFGMGAAKFKEFALISYDLYYTEDKCKEIRDAYFSLYRGVQQWHYKVGKTERNGFYTCQTLYGRRVYADGFTKATNFPVQGTEKDIMAFAICFIHDRFKKEGLDAALVNCVHDELVAECSEDIADKVLHIMEEEMVRAGKLILKTVRVKAEGKVVDLWSQKG